MTPLHTLAPRARRAAVSSILALVAGSLAMPLAAQTMVPPAPQNVMTLSASATLEVAMDLMSISFSTTREGLDAASVQSQLKQALDAALAEARRAAKPGEVDVRTGNFAMMPRYGQKGGITGWQGSAQLLVEGRDMQAISKLAGRIQTLSIARVSQTLSREAREKAEAETTAQAIARFRDRALAQAQLFGFSGFTIREVQVGTDGAPGPVPMVAMRARAMGAAADESLPVEAGKTSVTSTVSGSVLMVK